MPRSDGSDVRGEVVPSGTHRASNEAGDGKAEPGRGGLHTPPAGSTGHTGRSVGFQSCAHVLGEDGEDGCGSGRRMGWSWGEGGGQESGWESRRHPGRGGSDPYGQPEAGSTGLGDSLAKGDGERG